MKHIEIKRAWQGAAGCKNCSIRSSALFSDLNEEDFEKIHAPIIDLQYAPGELIYRQLEKVEHIYTLRKGFIKLLL